MDWSQFTAQPNGTRIFNHGYDQCVAVANQFNESVLGNAFVPVGSAYQWWTNYGNFTQLNTVYVQSQSPVPGAVVVWRGGRYNPVDGHIGVVTGVNGDGTYNTMEQNAEANRWLWRYTRNGANVLGFLHPRNNPVTPVGPVVRVTEGDEMYLVRDGLGSHFLVRNDRVDIITDQYNIGQLKLLLTSDPLNPTKMDVERVAKILKDPKNPQA